MRLLWLSLLIPFVKSYPLCLNHRSTGTTSTTTANTSAISTVSIIPIVDKTFNLLFEGNQKFRNGTEYQKEPLSRGYSPKIMFIGCSDNSFSPSTIFQTEIVASQVNVANQFSGKDTNANAAVAFAVHNLGVKHIIIMGHYGCKGVHAAMTLQKSSLDKAVNPWLKPIRDLFFRSKRVEIKNTRDLMRGRNEGAMIVEDDDTGFRALVEENVRENVRRLMNESILSTMYRRKKVEGDEDIKVYVHGFVFNAATGEVKDVGVTSEPGFKK
ncbi:carbonic anhydrase, partial [Collybia nuda]